MQLDRMPGKQHSSGSYTNGKDTVLVTGGLGFIGSHVVEDLIEHGFNVVIYDDMSNGRNFNKDAASTLLRDITVIDDFSYINTKVCTPKLKLWCLSYARHVRLSILFI